MQGPNGKQVRAARVLLDWDAPHLAALVGIRRESILAIENGLTQPRSGTLEKIIKVFNDNGVEFIDNQGVRFIPEGVDVLNGQDGLALFLDKVYDQLAAHGGLIAATGIDEDQWIAAYGADNSKKHFARMNALCKARADIKILSLTCEGVYPSSTSSYTEYRWISKDRFSLVPFYLCGDMLGIVVFQADPSPKIILIRSSAVAGAYRQQFEELWSSAKIIPSK